MGIRNILIRPLVTEKATSDEVHGNNVFVFEVTLDSERMISKKQ